MAETENMRRRTEREMQSARKYGHTSFARDLVGAIDNLARAI
jgi:molecular chaperone GrpE